MEWTALQITFEAVDQSPKYPLGVKMTYRAYAQVNCSVVSDN